MFGKFRNLHAGDVLILALVLMIVGTAAHLVRKSEVCAPADPVRLAVGGVVFHVPAALQPIQHPTRDQSQIPTERFYGQDRRGRYRYCQTDSDPPQPLDGFTLTEEALASFARTEGRFRSLEGMGLIAISARGFPHLDGPFLDYDLFQNPVGYNCLSIPTVSGGSHEYCRLRVNAAGKIGVSFDFDKRERPQSLWEASSRTVEKFIQSLAPSGLLE